MRFVSILALAFWLAPATHAAPVADTIDMGTWDCTHDARKTLSIGRGEHTLVWHGSCSGAEGFSVEMKPKMKDWKTKETHDDKANEIKLWIKNPGIGREVTFSIFVGFA